MPAPRSLNLDAYERRKLVALPVEIANASAFSLVVLILATLTGLWLYLLATDIYVSMVHAAQHAYLRPHEHAACLGVLLFGGLCLYGGLYASRATAQRRPSGVWGPWVAAIPLIAAVIYTFVAFDVARQTLGFVVGLYSAHWASLFEVAVFFTSAVFLVTWGSWRAIPALLATPLEDKIILRESSEESLRHGRVWRTALGIPGIVDFMPNGRRLAALLFVLSNSFYGLAICWLLVYFGFVMYRVVVVSEHFNADFTHPYVTDTAVQHMALALSATFLAMLGAPRIGGLLQSLAQRSVRSSIAQLLETDSRPPILFLRAFNDDQVELQGARLSLAGRLGRWLDGARNLDRLLLQEGTPYGPVVAIGNPSDKFPPYGAARGYFDDKTWQSAVADLAQKAQAIVICTDRTEGVRWELEHIAALGHLRKTLFLVHPKYRAPAENTSVAHDVAGRLQLAPADLTDAIQASQENKNKPARLALLGFFVEPDGAVHAGRSTTFSQLAYLLQVRWFLRSKLGFAKAA